MGGGGQKMSVFVHAHGIKTVHTGVRVKKFQNSVHVIVECPLFFSFFQLVQGKRDLNDKVISLLPGNRATPSLAENLVNYI